MKKIALFLLVGSFLSLAIACGGEAKKEEAPAADSTAVDSTVMDKANDAAGDSTHTDSTAH